MDIFKLFANTENEEFASKLATTLGPVYPYTRTVPKGYNAMNVNRKSFTGVGVTIVCVKRACSYSIGIYTDTIF
jgi:hypothetical protein